MTTSPAASSRASVLVDFALQGGGAHGAFTWGVLDRLLEEPWLRIDGISGTSAGAMNAAVLVDGYADGGAEGARAALENFWRRVSQAAVLSPFRRSPLDMLLGRWTLDYSPHVRRHGHDGARCSRPTTSARSGANPLRNILAEVHRFRPAGAGADQAVRHRDQCAHRPRPGLPQRRDHAGRAARLGLPADHVPGDRDRRRELLGRRLFRQSDHHAAGARMPLAATRSSSRSIRSSARASPRSARDILNRLNEVSFNAVLLKELRMIALLRQVADPGDSRGRQVGGHAHPPRLQRASWSDSAIRRSSTPSGSSCRMLRDEGRRAARGIPRPTTARISAGARRLDLDELLEGV